MVINQGMEMAKGMVETSHLHLNKLLQAHKARALRHTRPGSVLQGESAVQGPAQCEERWVDVTDESAVTCTLA